MFVYYIQKRGLFSEMRKVIQKVLRVLKLIYDPYDDVGIMMILNNSIIAIFMKVLNEDANPLYSISIKFLLFRNIIINY